ncbi:DNA-binding transcriptional regulator/RsmH inhibitor MraZ [Bradyrhizobium liaoningense]
MMRIEEGAGAGHHLDLAGLCHAGQAAGQLLDDTVLECAQLVEIDLRRAEADAMIRQMLDLIDHGRGVQQRLARDATDVEADAAERIVTLDQHGLHAKIGGAEGG